MHRFIRKSDDSVDTHLSHPKYRPDIDGLRAVAVIAVVAFHAFPTLIKGGFIGVDIFFVISGFLISTIIFENLERGTFSFTEFYARRVRRIFPALIIVLLSCLIFGWFILLADEYKELGKHVAAGAAFVSNLALWREAGYFDSSAETKPLLHLWSLGIEEQFYIIWPLILWLSWKSKSSLLAVSFLVAIISFTLNIRSILESPVATFYSPLTRFWELLSGTLLAWFTLYWRRPSFMMKSKASSNGPTVFHYFKLNLEWCGWPNILSFLGLMLILSGFYLISKESHFPGYLAVSPVAGAVLLISAGPMAWVNRVILANRFAIWFGLISFPLYLWHWPLLAFGRILYDQDPPLEYRMGAVTVAVLFAWLTVRFIEKPFRFGNERAKAKVALLSTLIFALGVSGVVIKASDFSQTHTAEKIAGVRRFENLIGPSLNWYRGKGDWLFLGNAYDNTVAKMKLTQVPSGQEVEQTRQLFANVASMAADFHTKVVLIIGPDKSSVYPEYLPDEVTPSDDRYISFFLEKLQGIPNLTVYDPTSFLLRIKEAEGLLYWMTDTHWNSKGAFLTYRGFSELLNLPFPKIDFKQGEAHSGDLIGISKLKDFELDASDNWEPVWNIAPVWTEREMESEQSTSFGMSTLITNDKALSDMYVWVVGDSFAGSLKPYFNATFSEVRYVGHWKEKLGDLPLDLAKAERKPDYIFVVRVERSF